MACRPRHRTSYRPSSQHPYACALKVRRLAKAEAYLLSPVFSDVDCEVLQETPNEPSPSWLITETGEAYAFVVQRCGLEHEEVEVQVERPRRGGGGLSASGEVRAGDECLYGNEGDECLYGNEGGDDCLYGKERCLASSSDSRTLLTILCYRKLERDFGGSSWGGQNGGIGGNRYFLWKFGRRFKLPSDACPEGATAAQEDGALTVVVPRRPSLRTQWLRKAANSKGAAAMHALYRGQENALGEGVQLRDGGGMWEASLGDRMQMRPTTGVWDNGSGAQNAFNARTEARLLEIKWINFNFGGSSSAAQEEEQQQQQQQQGGGMGGWGQANSFCQFDSTMINLDLDLMECS